MDYNEDIRTIIPLLTPKNWKKLRGVYKAGEYRDRGSYATLRECYKFPFEFVSEEEDEDYSFTAIVDRKRRRVYLSGSGDQAFGTFVILKDDKKILPEQASRLLDEASMIICAALHRNGILQPDPGEPRQVIRYARKKARDRVLPKNQEFFTKVVRGTASLYGKPPATEGVAYCRVENFVVRVTAFQFWDDDRGRWVTEFDHQIRGRHARYWHHNVFDGGDVIGKEGHKASWCVPEEYTAAELDEIQKILGFVAIGLRM